MSSGSTVKFVNWLRNTVGIVAIAALAGCVVRAGPGFVTFRPDIYVVPPPPVYYAPPPPPPTVVYEQAPPPAPVAVSSNDDLQRLVAPIALYPDPLLADILPASTYPDQIQAAAQWLATYPDPSEGEIAAQPWDPTVQALCHYPTVLSYMASQMDWTQSLGSAIANEQPDVMASIQDLRAQAYADGSLHDTPEQRVVVVGDPVIYIIPTDPDVIYVPAYDPVLVYQGPYAITFGVRFVAGAWLVHGFDWDNHYIFYGDWHGGWIHGPYGWRRDPYWVPPAYYHPWGRDARWGPAPHVDHFAFRAEVARSQWHPVEAAHREEVRNLRGQGQLPEHGNARPDVVHAAPPAAHGQPGPHPQPEQKSAHSGGSQGSDGSDEKKH